MRTSTLVTAILLLAAALFLIGAGPIKYSEELVSGSTPGNHDLDCTVIRPWTVSSGPQNYQYPVIAWANGWGYNNIAGETILDGYKPGLIEWALDGPYIVIAANQWSVQESDVLQCIQWLVDQSKTSDSEYQYYDVVNTEKVGLAGHSQGGGAVIKAGGDGTDRFSIAAVVAMNPYGPAWVNPGDQDGPVLLLGGTDDTTTPFDSYKAVWDAIKTNTIGGVNAVLEGGTHNSEAWGEPDGCDTLCAQDYDFGEYQIVSELWWAYYLNGSERSGRTLSRLLNKSPWFTEFSNDSIDN